jgi:hypothetical protein
MFIVVRLEMGRMVNRIGEKKCIGGSCNAKETYRHKLLG